MHGQICDKTMVVGRQPHGSLLRSLEAAAIRAFDRLMLWHERTRTRRLLGTLDDRMLSDIGMDRASAAREENTPFWR